MTPAQMEKIAQKRLAEFINRSAGQHLRAMRVASKKRGNV
jgi:hypothetical protein